MPSLKATHIVEAPVVKHCWLISVNDMFTSVSLCLSVGHVTVTMHWDSTCLIDCCVYVQSKLHMSQYTMEDWLQMERELTRERGLWGPPVGSDLDKWMLDMTEGFTRHFIVFVIYCSFIRFHYVSWYCLHHHKGSTESGSEMTSLGCRSSIPRNWFVWNLAVSLNYVHVIWVENFWQYGERYTLFFLQILCLLHIIQQY